MLFNTPNVLHYPQCPPLILYNACIPAKCRLCSTRSFSDSSLLVGLLWVSCVVCSFLYTDVSSDDVAGVVSLFVCCVVCTGPRRAAWLKNALDVSHVSSYMTKYSVSAGQGIPTHHRNNRYTMRARSRIVSLLFAKCILDLTRSATNPKRPKNSSHRRVDEPKRVPRCVLPQCSVWSNLFRYHQWRLWTKKSFSYIILR